ncbi:hypothetical protein CSOJ01_00129 [Colletotrichum sojae]|uniref:Uncharacterized protein n=1 Tax=Colletotrichum sojae TaxID=2175907 RepID=A0A8H6N6V3_9PEZI|nr:hypothetical protein CSOJ01_00129 [Colletotrichum sojae]
MSDVLPFGPHRRLPHHLIALHEYRRDTDPPAQISLSRWNAGRVGSRAGTLKIAPMLAIPVAAAALRARRRKRDSESEQVRGGPRESVVWAETGLHWAAQPAPRLSEAGHGPR